MTGTTKYYNPESDMEVCSPSSTPITMYIIAMAIFLDPLGTTLLYFAYRRLKANGAAGGTERENARNHC